MLGATIGMNLLFSCDPRVARASGRDIALVYIAPESCPEAPEFAADVHARTERAWLAEDNRALEVLRVTIEARGAEIVGQVDLVTPTGRTVRTLSDASCADLVAALALSAALMLDREAPPESPARSRSTPGAADAPEATRHPTPKPPPARPGFRAVVGVDVEWVDAIAPIGLIGPAPFIEVGRISEGLFAPALRLSLRHLRSGVVDAPDDDTRFEWTAGRVELCPLRFPAQSSLSVAPCAGVGAGVLLGAGVDGPAPRTEPRFWFDVFAGGRVGALLWERLLLEAQAGVVLPITRYEYVFRQPDRTVHRVGPVVPALAVGVGLNFP
jgi:hypothetical protein